MAVICIDEKVWTALVAKMDALAARARQVERQYEPGMDSRWIDSQDVCLALDITKRTLQTYRERGFIPFSNVGGKYFYKESDVAVFLEAKTVRKATTAARTQPQAKQDYQPQKV